MWRTGGSTPAVPDGGAPRLPAGSFFYCSVELPRGSSSSF